MKSPAEEWAATTGKRMFAAHLARRAADAWREAVGTHAGTFYFWLGADGEREAA